MEKVNIMELKLDDFDIKGLLENVINDIKEHHNIKYKYTYTISKYTWDKFETKAIPILATTETSKLYTEYGIYHGDYFTVISTKINLDTIRFVFTNKIKQFTKEFIEHELCITYGVFDIDYIGNTLFLIPKRTQDENPIFSNDIVESLIDEINMFSNAKTKYTKLNMIHKRGFLLYGMPGNGKTTLIKHIITKLDAISIICNVKSESHISFITSFLKDTKYDDKLKIIIMEDIDGFSTYSRSELLNMLDGIGSIKKVVFIATTNYPTTLDLGLKNRPSRFDKFIYIDKPDEVGRGLLLDNYFKLTKIVRHELIELTEGFPAAYFKELYLLTVLLNISIKEALIEIETRVNIYKSVNTVTD